MKLPCDLAASRTGQSGPPGFVEFWTCRGHNPRDTSTYPLFCHDFKLPQILKTSTKLVVFTTFSCHDIKISTSAPADWSLSRAYPRLLVHRMAVCTGRRLNVIWLHGCGHSMHTTNALMCVTPLLEHHAAAQLLSFCVIT